MTTPPNLAGLPPGPDLSEASQTFAWFSRPYELLRQCAASLGDTFTLRIRGWGPQVFVTRPEAIRDVFRADCHDLQGGKGNAFLRPLFGDASLLLLDDEPHRDARKLLLPAFHGDRMRVHGRVVQEITRAVTATWIEQPRVAVQRGLLEISLEVIVRAIFGIAENAPKLRELLSRVLRAIGTSVVGAEPGAATTYQVVASALDDALVTEIAARRSGSKHDDVLQTLVSDSGMSDRELRDHLVTLLLAGHDTTATTLGWALALLHDNPDARGRLVAEIDALGDDRDPTLVARLPYLHAVVCETLRLRPVVPAVSRWIRRPIRIDGVELPEGAYVAACIYLTHLRAELYDEPERFVPERFLGRVPSPYEFLPFGGGERRCIGMAFALHEMKIVLAELVARFDFALASRAELRPVRRSIIIGPSEELPMRVTSRRTQETSP